MHASRRSGQAPLLLVSLACLLVSIRLLAGFICTTCFTDFEKPKTRNFHLHSGGDRDPCHHGQVTTGSPLVAWACVVTGDESAFILPEIPRLPIIVSLLVLLVLLVVSSPDRPLIAAHGRGPPLDTLVL
ncbi:MAG: hypothetical protein HOP22_03260 [Nitrospiraceae bacterium]|nr:hypothetical protein [Nitrospiraceae bacterium]